METELPYYMERLGYDYDPRYHIELIFPIDNKIVMVDKGRRKPWMGLAKHNQGGSIMVWCYEDQEHYSVLFGRFRLATEMEIVLYGQI